MENKKKILIFTSKKNIKIVKKKLSLLKKKYIIKFIYDEKKIINSDVFISFINGKIFKESILNKFNISINFHPGTPNLPGRDPHHWAIFLKKKNYGVTIHRMKKKIDSGPIIFTSVFKIKTKDNPQILRKKAFNLCLKILSKNFTKIIDDKLRQKKKKFGLRMLERDLIFII